MVLAARPQPAMGPPSPLLSNDDAPLLSGWSESEKNAPDASEIFYRRLKPRRRGCLWTAGLFVFVLLAGSGFWATRDPSQSISGASQSFAEQAAVPPEAALVPQTTTTAPEAYSEEEPSVSSDEPVIAEAGNAGWLSDLRNAALNAIAPEDYVLHDKATRLSFDGTDTVEQLDEKVCGTSPCQFVVIGSVREGNSKAQLHVTQVAHLASSLGRVLVLPNVHFGLFSSCYEHPFDLYYDISQLAEYLGVQVMLMPDFERYTQRRAALGQQLTAQTVRFGHNAHDTVRGKLGENFSTQLATTEAVENACHRKASLNLSAYKPAFVDHDLENYERLPEFGRYVDRTFNSPEYLKRFSTTDGPARSPDVYHVLWMVQRRLWQEGKPGGRMYDALLPYHQRWRNLADELVENLTPFVALHWRQEAIHPGHKFSPDFVSCAKAAHKKLNQFDDSLKSVYFLTDYPVGGTVHSITYDRTLKSNAKYRKEADAGINELYAWPGFHSSPEGESVRILTLDELELDVPLAAGERIPMKDFDFGLLGIIDKMMADRAQTYLTGQPHLCARSSSFSQLVVEERHLQKGNPGSLVRDEVQYFPDEGRFLRYEYD